MLCLVDHGDRYNDVQKVFILEWEYGAVGQFRQYKREIGLLKEDTTSKDSEIA